VAGKYNIGKLSFYAFVVDLWTFFFKKEMNCVFQEFRWLEFKCLGLSVVLTVLFVYSEFKEYASVVSVFFLAYAAGLYYFYSVLKQLYFSRPSLQYEATKTEYLSVSGI
jgi:hypothetical protein